MNGRVVSDHCGAILPVSQWIFKSAAIQWLAENGVIGQGTICPSCSECDASFMEKKNLNPQL